MFYETEENDNNDCFNKGLWYNTAICSKLHVKLFEYFIRHSRTDIYHIMCSIIAHDKQQPSYEYEEISIRDRPITKNKTTEALVALGATLNVIDCWIQLFPHNYKVIWKMYNKAMKILLKKYQQ